MYTCTVRIVNWCPVCKTSISDAEVEHEEQDGFFWHINYPVVGEEGRFVEIATTRPETLFGDTAVAVNPDDERYKDIVGKTLKLPMTDREIPVIADAYVDKEFGTGCVKITPAHDPNDFEVGKRHNLEEIVVINDDATMNEKAGKYAGMDRYECRKALVDDLKKEGLLVKVVPHSHNVGVHDRCHTTVEPMIKQQWFVKMDEMIKPAVEGVKNGDIKLLPKRMDKLAKIDSSPYHLVLLCENNEGYQNLIKLVSAAYTEGFYSKPRVDVELLEKYHNGLICLSACLAGEIPRKLTNGDYDAAKQTALKYRDIFGRDNYFIELQNHKFADQQRILPMLIRLSRETGIPMVCTNDAHYLRRSDANAQRVLMCISTGTTLDDPSRLEFPTNEFYVKSAEEMAELFPSQPESLENTVKIADRCNVSFEFGKTKLPYFHIDGVSDNEKFLRDMCMKGLYKRYENPTKEALKRVDYGTDIL